MRLASHLVLASGSPRRRELLSGLGLKFTVRPADVDETPWVLERPEDTVLRLAKDKAAAGQQYGELVVGADTVVVLDGELLGKPKDPEDARQMLARIAGREHIVLTGLAVTDMPYPDIPRMTAEVASSRVKMAYLTPEEIDWYVATGEPMDKAGSYAIQGLGALFVEEVYGNYTNVVGLPLPMLGRKLQVLGYELGDFR